MLLIYSHKIPQRVSYTMKQVFKGILGMDIGFTVKVEEFIRHDGPKITYTKQPLQNEFFIRSHPLLFEQGIDEREIQVADWDGLPCFFPAGADSSLPYDIFAASFYLLTRYEEYLPHTTDAYGRFSPTESLAYKEGFLKIPVIDLWAQRLKKALKERFPDIQSHERTYSFTPVIDVTTSHCYAHKGLVRSVGGLFLDLFTLEFKRVWERVAVGLNIRKDPYDNFDALIAWHKQLRIRSIFFFQFADYSRFDKNVSITNNAFQDLVKHVADYSTVSLAASFSSFGDVELLKHEKAGLEQVIHRPMGKLRTRYNRIQVPETYRDMVDAEFSQDYTMGYTHEAGFRAGTCTPFYFYDIPLEVQQPIKLHPFAIHDYALAEMDMDMAEELMDGLYHGIRKVGGDMVMVFSNELLGGQGHLDWMSLYEKSLKKYHV